MTDGASDGRALSGDDGLQVAAAGSVVTPGFSTLNTNDAFERENALLHARRAGTSSVAGAEPAIGVEAAAGVKRDPLLEQVMREERASA